MHWSKKMSWSGYWVCVPVTLFTFLHSNHRSSATMPMTWKSLSPANFLHEPALRPVMSARMAFLLNNSFRHHRSFNDGSVPITLYPPSFFPRASIAGRIISIHKLSLPHDRHALGVQCPSVYTHKYLLILSSTITVTLLVNVFHQTYWVRECVSGRMKIKRWERLI